MKINTEVGASVWKDQTFKTKYLGYIINKYDKTINDKKVTQIISSQAALYQHFQVSMS